MADVPLWYWQVLGAVVLGLGLGVVLGGFRSQRKARGKAARAALAAPTPTSGRAPAAGRSARAAATPAPAAAPASAAATGDATQQRLLERLRETNLDLTAKLRAATDAHARELLERSQAQQVDQQRHERQMEDLRQGHAAELAHLMQVMVEQVDGMQRDHANHVRALESEIERVRHTTSGADGDPSNALTRPVGVTGGGDTRPPPPRRSRLGG